MPFQSDWRHCRKCRCLFFDGWDDKGVCRAGNGHEPQGNLYQLWHGDSVPKPYKQTDWRFCRKCFCLFFDGWDSKGVCPAGSGGHSAQGSYLFTLLHGDIPPGRDPYPRQPYWRFCHKCFSLFFALKGDPGKCPAGNGHEQKGSFLFELVRSEHGGIPKPPVPKRLQFRLRYFAEHESTDSFFQGASDEVWISAIGVDSAQLGVGPNKEPEMPTITGPTLGDVSDDAVRGPWQEDPLPIIEFDLTRRGDWPRTFAVTLFLVEEDSEQVAENVQYVESEVGQQIKTEIERSAESLGAAAIAAAIGTGIFPGAGTAVGAALGALAGAGYDLIIAAIQEGLENEVFTPQTLMIEVAGPDAFRSHPDIGQPQILSVDEHGASYGIEYDWHLVV